MLFDKLFNKNKRVAALVFNDGKVLVFTEDNFKRYESEITDHVHDDLTIDDIHDKGIQVKEINIYEDVLDCPNQTLYSIPYNKNKIPERSSRVPKEILDIVWNYLEGAKGKEKENTFHLKKSAVTN